MFRIDNKTGKIFLDQDTMNEYLINMEVSKAPTFFYFFNIGRYKIKKDHKLDKMNKLKSFSMIIFTPETKEKVLVEIDLQYGKEIIDYNFNYLNKLSLSELNEIKSKKIFQKMIFKIYAESVQEIFNSLNKKLGI